MKKIIKNRMSIEDLALSMDRSFKKVENLIEKKIDGLAVSTVRGFEGVEKRFNSIEEDLKGLKNQLAGVNNRIDDMSTTRVKYEDHNKLKMRVSVVEEKVGIKSA